MFEPKWIALAAAEQGTHEIRGAAENPKIIAYRTDARCAWLKGSEEAVAWCAIFVNAMLERAGVRGTRSPAAKSFCGSPHFVRLAGPALGAITVIERNPPHPSLGHVAFCVGADRANVTLLGGNQGDAVNRARFARSRVAGFYWPATLPLPKCGDFAPAAPASAGGKVV